jgi:[ribosomal protein S5]-alanine N-acetyltransferase
MELTLNRSVIRSYQPDDAESLAKHAGTYSVARNLNLMPHPYSRQDAVYWIGVASSGKPETHFAITVSDAVVGGIGFQLTDPARTGVSRHVAEFGYWLGEEFWGRGIMSEAVPAFVEWGFSALDLVRIEAFVYARNPASAHVLRKAGFAFEGTLRARYFKEGEFIDALAYAKVRLPKTATVME